MGSWPPGAHQVEGRQADNSSTELEVSAILETVTRVGLSGQMSGTMCRETECKAGAEAQSPGSPGHVERAIFMERDSEERLTMAEKSLKSWGKGLHGKNIQPFLRRKVAELKLSFGC